MACPCCDEDYATLCREDGVPGGVLLNCDGEYVWFDPTTGQPLTPAEVDALVPCVPEPCPFVDPQTVSWVEVAPNVVQKDLGGGWIITLEVTQFSTSPSGVVAVSPCVPSSSNHAGIEIGGNCAAGASCGYTEPMDIRLSSNRPWPATTALNLFDIDGNADTGGVPTAFPNEILEQLFPNVPTSIAGPDAARYRDKTGGHPNRLHGANQGPDNGLEFHVVFTDPLPQALDFRFWGSCIGIDMIFPACP